MPPPALSTAFAELSQAEEIHLMDDQDDRSERDLLDESTLGLHVELLPGKALSQLEEPPAVEEADWPHFRRLVSFSVQTGLCPLVPAPSAEDGAVSRIRRTMVRELEESRSLGLSEDDVRLLAGELHRPGVLEGAALAVRRSVGKVLGSVWKTFPLREGVDRAVETFVEGYLLLHAAGLPQALRPAGRTPERVRVVRAAVESTLRDANVTPIRTLIGRSFQSSSGRLSEAAAKLGAAGSAADEAPLQEAEELVDQLAGALWEDQERLDALERAFKE